MTCDLYYKGNDATTEEHSKDVTATDSSLNVASGTKQRSRSSSPMKKEGNPFLFNKLVTFFVNVISELKYCIIVITV